MRDKALSLIEKELIEIKEHFEIIDGGWGLDLNLIENDISIRLLGFDLMGLIIDRILEEGFEVKLRNGGVFVESKDPYIPVYYDNQTNKLIIVEDSEDKSYIFKYKGDRYAYLGKL